jgi:phosphohistidine phosphatase SixA
MEEINKEKKVYYDQEKRKEYNKKYYHENKENILQLMLNKEDCKFCGKSITHQNMMKHTETKLCIKRYKINNKFKYEM